MGLSGNITNSMRPPRLPSNLVLMFKVTFRVCSDKPVIRVFRSHGSASIKGQSWGTVWTIHKKTGEIASIVLNEDLYVVTARWIVFEFS